MQQLTHTTSNEPRACHNDAAEHDLLCVVQPTGVMNTAKLLITLSDEIASRLQQTHPHAQIDFTTLYCLIGREDCLELRMPGGLHNWAILMLPPPRDVAFVPAPGTSAQVGQPRVCTSNTWQLEARVDHNVVVHTVHRQTGALRSVIVALDDATLDELNHLSDERWPPSVETSRRLWQKLLAASPSLRVIEQDALSDADESREAMLSRTPIVNGEPADEADDPHIASWLASGRRWLERMVPPVPKLQETVWRLRTEWTLDALIRSSFKAPLDKQIDAFDDIDDSLFDSWVDDEDEDSGLNLRALSLLRRMAASEPLFATTAAYNWVIAANPSDHAIRLQLCYDVVIAPRKQQEEGLSTAFECFSAWLNAQSSVGLNS